MASDNVREVLPRGDAWEVRAPGAARASAVSSTRSVAIERAREILGNLGGGRLTIRNPDSGAESEMVEASPRLVSVSPLGASQNDSTHSLRGGPTLVRLVADIDREVARVQTLPMNSGPDVSPLDDPILRLRLFVDLYSDEIGHVTAIRDRYVHEKVTVDQPALDEGLSYAKRLLDVLASIELTFDYQGQWVAMRGTRVVDADVNLESLMDRVSQLRHVRMVYQGQIPESGSAE